MPNYYVFYSLSSSQQILAPKENSFFCQRKLNLGGSVMTGYLCLTFFFWFYSYDFYFLFCISLFVLFLFVIFVFDNSFNFTNSITATEMSKKIKIKSWLKRLIICIKHEIKFYLYLLHGILGRDSHSKKSPLEGKWLIWYPGVVKG